MNPGQEPTGSSPVITHLVAPASFGGTESVITTLVAAHLRAGWSVNVVGVFPAPPEKQPFWEGIQRLGAPAVPVVTVGRRYLRERRVLAGVLRGLGTRVLHTHGFRADVVGAPVGRRMGMATVTTVHGFTGGGLLTRIYEGLQRRAFRNFDAVVAVSALLREELARAGVPDSRLHLVRNAWTPAAAPLPRKAALAALGIGSTVPDMASVVGWVGRMSEEKAPDVALQAFLAMVGSRPRRDAHLVMVGDGPLRPDLEAAAAAAGSGHRVHFPGAVPDAGRLLNAFDAVVLSSWTEGTPMVLLEAMAAAVPVVTTAVGGIPDVVSQREAWLVPAGDVRGMSRALGEILDHRGAAEARAGAACRRLEHDLSVDDFARSYGEIYRACLERSG